MADEKPEPLLFIVRKIVQSPEYLKVDVAARVRDQFEESYVQNPLVRAVTDGSTTYPEAYERTYREFDHGRAYLPNLELTDLWEKNPDLVALIGGPIPHRVLPLDPLSLGGVSVLAASSSFLCAGCDAKVGYSRRDILRIGAILMPVGIAGAVCGAGLSSISDSNWRELEGRAHELQKYHEKFYKIH